MKFTIHTFGCQMNYADSARIRAVLEHCWRTWTENAIDADIVIFDTCSVRQKAEDKITGKLKTIASHQKVWITWCMIQHTLRIRKFTSSPFVQGNFLEIAQQQTPLIIGYTNEEIKTYRLWSSSIIPINHAFNPLFHRLHNQRPNIELMRRIDDTWHLPSILQRLWYHIPPSVHTFNEYENIFPTQIPTSMNSHIKTAYIPISTWCNQFCAYCIVPYARGLERYFPKDHILQEVRHHLDQGVQEILLLGQIVNKHPEFIHIIQDILTFPQVKRLRYTSPYPTYYHQKLFELHEQAPQLCPHIHIPLQSWSDMILKKMFRGYTLDQTKQRINTIKNLKRPISITTDIIVGFPGETDQDFEATCELVRYAEFDMIYIGKYSPRPGTYAAKHYPDDIPSSIKHQRRNILNDLLTQQSQKNNIKEIGKTRTALINTIRKNEKGYLLEWYTEHMKHVQIPLTWDNISNIHPGDFLPIRITDSAPFILYGEII